MTPQQMNEERARFALERQILRDAHWLHPTAVRRLVDAAAESLAFKDHLLAGDPLDVASAVAEARDSEIGRLIFADRGAPAQGLSDEEMERMTPQQRMAWARKKKP